MRYSIGLRVHDSIPGTLKERADFIRAQGFTCVHLALSKVLGKQMMEPGVLTPGLAEAVKADLGGLAVAVLGCYLNLAEPDESLYPGIVRKYTAHLRFQRWLGAGMVGTETGHLPESIVHAEDVEQMDRAADFYIERLKPVVENAEKLGAILAIEPVWHHSIRNARCARRMLDAIHSPNLGIIFDPVNLISAYHTDRANETVQEAIDLLGDEILMVHLKDWVPGEEGKLPAVAAGTGRMNYSAVARFIREKKPGVQMTLENTKPDNAVQARKFVEGLLEQE